MKSAEIKLDKSTLATIRRLALDKYKERGNCDGSLYLSPEEMVARAYAEATLALLAMKGISIAVK